MRLRTTLLVAAACLVFTRGAPAQAPRALSDSAFAQLSSALSERGGFFDTDNLITNEDSYLLPLSTLRRLGVQGGAYLGVGPDQNFSYIAAVRPRIAFIVDIRRDNLIEHQLFKAVFALARTRIDYLCLLFGLEPPPDTTGWGARSITDLLRHVDSVRVTKVDTRAVRERVADRVRKSALHLMAADIATARRFHDAFVADGPDLQFASFNRAPQPYYPDLRRLLLEKDRTGREGNFLAREADFQFVKSLEDRNLVIPVVGDFAGTRALAEVARWLRENRETVSAFYTSNVEQYLFRDGGFRQFALNAALLPADERSVFVRSFFMGGHPQSVAGYHATQLVQSMRRFGEVVQQRGYVSYGELIRSDLIVP